MHTIEVCLLISCKVFHESNYNANLTFIHTYINKRTLLLAVHANAICLHRLWKIICSINFNEFEIYHDPDSALFCPSSVSGLPEATITVTEKKVKEVMTLEDETFSKFYRQVEELPATINKVEMDDDFDAIFGPQVPK